MDLVIVLPFLGKLSLDLRTRLKTLSVIFKSLTRISDFSSLKIKLPIACALMSLTTFRVVDAMLPITTNYPGI